MQQRGAAFDGGAHRGLVLFELLAAHHGAHLCGLEAVAGGVLRGFLGEGLKERLADAGRDVDAGRGGAGLAGEAERAGGHHLGGLAGIGVVQDQHAVLAAHFQLDPGAAGVEDLLQPEPHVGGAGEGQPGDAGIAGQGVAHHAALAVDHVEHAGGQPGVLQGAGQVRGGERGELGRLDDHGVAADQRRARSSRPGWRWGSSTA